MELVKNQFRCIRDLIIKNASSLIDVKMSSNISEKGKNTNDIQHNTLPNCKLMPESSIVSPQRV